MVIGKKEEGVGSTYRQEGFTLIELMVVIGIVGVLAAGLIATINPFTQFAKARDARRKSDLKTITTLLNEYYNDNGQYPPAGTCLNGSGNWVFTLSGGACGGTGGSNWIPALVPKYTASLPVDPLNNLVNPWNNGNYTYAYGNVSSDGQHYDLIAQLEYQQDPARCGLQDYMYNYPSANHWCTAFGGAFSNYIFQINHE